MKLENQVCSLELAKKLKELGFKQDSLWYWCRGENIKDFELALENEAYSLSDSKDYYGGFSCGCCSELFYINKEGEIYSAYTVAELGEMLPVQIMGSLINQTPYITAEHNLRVDLDDDGMLCAEENEANARAKRLIYLKENNLI